MTFLLCSDNPAQSKEMNFIHAGCSMDSTQVRNNSYRYGLWSVMYVIDSQLLTLFVTGQKKEEESLLIISQNSKISKNVCQLLISGLDFLSSV